jgi:hypothetical protein
MSLSFGSDPEFMLVDEGNNLKSAISLLPKKANAKPYYGSSIYYDNVLAEIAVKPSWTKEEFLKNVKKSLNKLAQLIYPLKFKVCASASYPNKELFSHEARIAGCNPEWNVYNLQCVLPPEEVISKTNFRTAGGHIHVGSKSLQESSSIFNFIRMMDLFVGIPSLFMDKDPSSKERRKIYGRAGTHRITDYGIEYRPLGNFWYSSPEHAELIYDLTMFVYSFVNMGEHDKFWSVDESLLDCEDPSKAYTCFGYDCDMLEMSINNCDLKNANHFMTFISHYIPGDLFDSILKMVNEKKLPDPYASWGISYVPNSNKRLR